MITPLTWRRLAATLIIISAAAALRIWPLGSLGSTLAWLTFYPAVMVISIYGGLWSGLIATFLACIISAKLWFLIVENPFIKSQADWIGMAVFILTSLMISSVTEAMRRANVRAKEAQEKAETANRAKSTFLANMSHELRTPLSAILGYSQLMKRNKELPEEIHEYINIINRSGEHLLSLINDVLETSKIEAGRIILEPVTFDLHNLIGEIEKMFREKAVMKELKFDITGINDVPKYIIADATKFRIVLINLLGNAFKFTDKGHIIVRFSTKSGPETKMFLKVDIEDTGSGISAAEIEKLFKYFVQTESGRKSQSGTGLGLAISREYVRMMGGDITVTSNEGTGSTFSFTFQFTWGNEKVIKKITGQRIVKRLKPGEKIPRILVAEDNDENRNLLARFLKITGFEVAEAVDGKEAVELFEKWKPDLIWMDIRLPVIDGKEATRIIRSKETGKRVKIIALSAHALGEERKEIIDSGCDGFVAKPFRETEIFETMKKHLNIDYIYAEKEEISENRSDSLSQIPDMSLLNPEFMSELEEAVSNTDAVKIERLAEKIQQEHPEISGFLKNCAGDFDYKTITVSLNNLSDK